MARRRQTPSQVRCQSALECEIVFNTSHVSVDECERHGKAEVRAQPVPHDLKIRPSRIKGAAKFVGAQDARSAKDRVFESGAGCVPDAEGGVVGQRKRRLLDNTLKIRRRRPQNKLDADVIACLSQGCHQVFADGLLDE
jgi:hypothetical protein